jgi:hypothetical protein
MRRTILTLLSGGAFGAVATYTLMGSRAPELPSLDQLTANAVAPTPFEASTARPSAAGVGNDAPPPAAQRGTLYLLAAASDERALRALIDDAASLAPSPMRRVTLEALLTRYAEIDPQAAIRTAERLGVGDSTAASLFEIWVAAAPAEALQRTLELDDAAEAQSALRRVGQAWARVDPRAALRQSDSIRDPQRKAAFDDGALREWARSEPGAVFEYLLEGTRSDSLANAFGPSFGPAQAGASVLMEIARADPVRVLDATDRLPPSLRQFAPQIALQALAQQNPERAVAYAEAQTGPLRQQYLQSVAAAYGRRDPDAALAWARAAAPRDRNVLAAVIGGIAQDDPERAIDIALSEPDRMVRIQAAQMAAMNVRMMDGETVARLADKLVGDGARAASPEVLDTLTSVWASNDPQAAVEWLLANGDRIDSNSFRQAAYQLAMREPELAASYVQRVPAAARAAWISMVAQGYAQTAPDQATLWLEQIRGEPGYDEAAAAVVQGVAQRDPADAARLYDSLGATGSQVEMVGSMIASQWAAQDPAAAAEWAQRLESDQVRTTALRGIANQWALQDGYAARNWVLGLPRGRERDVALGALLGALTVNRDEPLDPALVSAFSSDQAAQQALVPIVVQRGQRDAVEGRALMDAYITDPQLRRQVEQMLTSNRGRGAMLGVSQAIGGFVTGPNMVPFVPPPPRERWR